MSTTAWMDVRLLAARANQRLGWAGLTGAALIVGATAWLTVAWQVHTMPLPGLDEPAVLAPESLNQGVPLGVNLRLAAEHEIPLLLSLVQQTIVNNGLAWAAASYKLTSATETVPAFLEVRCTLVGAYPKLRAAMAQLLSGVPGLTIRDLAMTRANADVADVDAKLTLVVYLRDEPTPAGSTTPRAKP